MTLDDQLRRALKPVDPGVGFTARVLAAVEGGATGAPAGQPAAPVAEPRSVVRRFGTRRRWIWPALAASLVGAVAGMRWVDERREVERGLAARNQVMQALRLTSSKLHVARVVVAPVD